ncbi:hypothetical protein L7F22_041921 [Adiantum nelumboides]|nr:hypothetical protein [Adiantum nelumboides]
MAGGRATFTLSSRIIFRTHGVLNSSTHTGHIHEALLDSGSTISSISQSLVDKLGLFTKSTNPISVIFGDNQKLDSSEQVVVFTFSIGSKNFHHEFYVLPRQLFPLILGCDCTSSTINFLVSHSIRTGDAFPIKTLIRQRSPMEMERINKAIDDMLTKGVIVPSNSDWASEPHLVKKDDGSYRFCIDFRPLNQVTQHDVYPLSRLDDLLDQLGQSKYFTSLDLASGYWQIPLNPDDAHKIALRTLRGFYQFSRMPFGLSNARSTFQRIANQIFHDLIQLKVVIVCLDDILIHTKTWSKHMTVLNRIKEFNLQLQF